MKPLLLNKQIITVTALLLVGFAILGILAWYFSSIAVNLIISFLVLYMVNPFMEKLKERGFSSMTSFSIVIGIFTSLTLLLLLISLPLISTQLQSFDTQWEQAQERIEEDLFTEVTVEGQTQLYIPKFNLYIENEQFESMTQYFRQSIAQVVSSFIPMLFNILIIVPIITFILATQKEKLRRQIISFLPNRYFEVTLAITHDINENVKKFIYAKFIQTAILAIIAVACFLIIGLQGAIFIGLFVGLINIIPYLGPIFGAVPTLVLAFLFGDISLLLQALIVIAIVQAVDNLIIQPIIIPKLVSIHPLIVVIITLIGAQLFGAIGMVLAIPGFFVMKTTIEKIYEGLYVIYRKDVEL